MDCNALSAPNQLSFLKGSNTAEEFATPYEDSQPKIVNFAQYNTGTLSIGITPEQIGKCSAIKELIVTTELKKLADFVSQIQGLQEIKGVPSSLILPSVIGSVALECDCIEDFSDAIIQSAKIPVEIIDNCYCANGYPIWERLPEERMDFYNIFKLYRDSAYYLLTTGETMVSKRSLGGLARKLDIPGNKLIYLSKLYHWATRVNAYDGFMSYKQMERKSKEQALLLSDHSIMSNSLCNKAYEYLNKNVNNMTPKEVLQMLEIGLKFGRLSAGLSIDKPDNATPSMHNNFAIYNTTNQTEQRLNVNMASVENGSGSEVERQLQHNMKNEQNLLSILHVLQASGAMKTAVLAQQKKLDVMVEEQALVEQADQVEDTDTDEDEDTIDSVIVYRDFIPVGEENVTQ